MRRAVLFLVLAQALYEIGELPTGDPDDDYALLLMRRFYVPEAATEAGRRHRENVETFRTSIAKLKREQVGCGDPLD
jgi:hypothetical protein